MASCSPILVVDDDSSLLSTVEAILEDEGYCVKCAANGAEGLEFIEKALPKLVLLDMRMPHLNGWDFARILNERNIKLPIVVMTAATDARQWAQEIDARCYLAKPFDLSDLLETVDMCMHSTTGAHPPFTFS